jgi:hypothetical protein
MMRKLLLGDCAEDDSEDGSNGEKEDSFFLNDDNSSNGGSDDEDRDVDKVMSFVPTESAISAKDRQRILDKVQYILLIR